MFQGPEGIPCLLCTPGKQMAPDWLCSPYVISAGQEIAASSLGDK